MTRKDMPRFAITVALILLFALILGANPNNELLIGALIAMASTGVQYWLGSSDGSSKKTDQIDRMNEQASGKPDDPVHTVEER